METGGVFRVRHKESSFDESREGSFQEKFRPSAPPPYAPVDYSAGFDTMFWVVAGLSQLVGFICITLVVYWCTLYGGFAWNSNADLQFFVHPLLMVLGLIFFYGDSILVYRVLHFLPKFVLKLIHAGLHLLAIILSSVGLAAVFENHRKTNKADLYSLHSWVGITTFGFFCVQYVVSLVTFLVPVVPLSIRAKVMPFHTFFGLGIFILAVATAQMGLTERLLWTNNYTSGSYVEAGVIGNCLGLFLIVFAFLVVFIVTHSKYKRRPLPGEIPAPTN